MEEVFEEGEEGVVGAVGAGVVVDDEVVVGWVFGGVLLGRAAADVSGGVGFLVVGVSAGVFETADEEFAGEGDEDADVAVHGVFGEEVDAEFLAGFGEAPEAVEGEDVGEDAAAAVVVDEVEELEGQFFGGGGEAAVDGGAVVVVDVGVLVVEGAIQKPSAEGAGVEHACHEWFEFDVSVV